MLRCCCLCVAAPCADRCCFPLQTAKAHQKALTHAEPPFPCPSCSFVSALGACNSTQKMHPSAAAVSGNWQQQWLLLQMSMLVTSGTACYSLGVLWVQHALHLRKLAGLLGFAHGLEWSSGEEQTAVDQYTSDVDSGGTRRCLGHCTERVKVKACGEQASSQEDVLCNNLSVILPNLRCHKPQAATHARLSHYECPKHVRVFPSHPRAPGQQSPAAVSSCRESCSLSTQRITSCPNAVPKAT